MFDVEGMDWNNSPFEYFEKRRVNSFSYYTPESDEKNRITREVQPTVLFLNLLKNEQFRKKFIDTFCLVASSIFIPERCESIINSICNFIAPTMALYNNDSPWVTASLLINSFSAQRQVDLLNSMKNYEPFQLSSTEMQNAYIRSDIEGATLTFNNIPIPTQEYNGPFFSPAVINAEAPAGYNFIGWKSVKNSRTVIFDASKKWSYYDQGSLDGSKWYSQSYNDSSWPSGATPMGYASCSSDKTFNTSLDYGTDPENKRTTYYVRSSFNISSLESLDDYSEYKLTFVVDDGCVIYLNGKEIYRYNLPPGEIFYDTNALYYAVSNPDSRTIILDRSLLKNGSNLLAVEIHNESSGSTDIYWSASLDIVTKKPDKIVSKNTIYTLPSSGDIDIIACFNPITTKSHVQNPVVINEICADGSIYINDLYIKTDWIELYNTTDTDIDLKGLYLTDKLDKPKKWQIGTELAKDISTIIPAHGYKIIWCDKEEGISDLHAPFKLENVDKSSIMLTAEDEAWSDTLYYGQHDKLETIGRYPDASRKVYKMSHITIGKANQISSYSTIYPPDGDKSQGIESIATEETTPTVRYNLQGLPIISPLDNQIYIENGKKIIKK